MKTTARKPIMDTNGLPSLNRPQTMVVITRVRSTILAVVECVVWYHSELVNKSNKRMDLHKG